MVWGREREGGGEKTDGLVPGQVDEIEEGGRNVGAGRWASRGGAGTGTETGRGGGGGRRSVDGDVLCSDHAKGDGVGQGSGEEW